jgi:hypothetical protein
MPCFCPDYDTWHRTNVPDCRSYFQQKIAGLLTNASDCIHVFTASCRIAVEIPQLKGIFACKQKIQEVRTNWPDYKPSSHGGVKTAQDCCTCDCCTGCCTCDCCTGHQIAGCVSSKRCRVADQIHIKHCWIAGDVSIETTMPGC